MITPAQCRAARGLIDWSQSELAKHAHLGETTIRDFEAGRRVPTHNNHRAIEIALSDAGVEFIDADAKAGTGPGVRLCGAT